LCGNQQRSLTGWKDKATRGAKQATGRDRDNVSPIAAGLSVRGVVSSAWQLHNEPVSLWPGGRDGAGDDGPRSEREFLFKGTERTEQSGTGQSIGRCLSTPMNTDGAK